MSLDRIQSLPGRLALNPLPAAGGIPGAVTLGGQAGFVAGSAAASGGALFTTPTTLAGTVPTLGSGGTITHNGCGMVQLNTGAAVTGAIVQPGTAPGQELTIINISANTITMAAAATSNVAGGTTAVVPATAGLLLKWNALDARWYDVG